MGRSRTCQTNMILTVFASDLTTKPVFSPLIQLSKFSVGFQGGTKHNGAYLAMYLDLMRSFEGVNDCSMDFPGVTIVYGGQFNEAKTYEVIYNGPVGLSGGADLCKLLNNDDFYSGLLQKYKLPQIK